MSQSSNLVVVANRQRKFNLDVDALSHAVATVLDGCGEVDQEVSVVLVSDRTMRGINRDYRGLKGTTDVISFAMREGPHGDPSGTLLGDLVISLETVARQCLEPFGDGRPETGTPQRELALMTIHGLLHLLGHDHELGPKESAAMIQREVELFDRYWKLFPEWR